MVKYRKPCSRRSYRPWYKFDGRGYVGNNTTGNNCDIFHHRLCVQPNRICSSTQSFAKHETINTLNEYASTTVIIGYIHISNYSYQTAISICKILKAVNY